MSRAKRCLPSARDEFFLYGVVTVVHVAGEAVFFTLAGLTFAWLFDRTGDFFCELVFFFDSGSVLILVTELVRAVLASFSFDEAILSLRELSSNLVWIVAPDALVTTVFLVLSGINCCLFDKNVCFQAGLALY